MAKRKETDEATTAVAEEPQREYVRHETWASFKFRHGEHLVVGDEVELRPGVWGYSVIFEDGATARSMHKISHGGVEPPLEDIVECGRLRLRYAEEKLNQELKEYDAYRAECIQQANWHLKYPQSCPPPPANMDEVLTAGEQRIDRWQKRVAELNGILDKLDPQRIAKRERAEADLKAAEERKAIYDQAMARLNQVPNIAPMQEAEDVFSPEETGNEDAQ